ncbi:MAG: hypothetical protein JJE39_01455 [Vicinamibacteria bacterium]|nr:hypothetical protein [Vicinamibacteria bacterium]
MRRVAARVAAAVVLEAGKAGLGRRILEKDVEALVSTSMWDPSYVPYDPMPSD